MLKVLLHLGAIRRSTSLRHAPGCMLNELDVQLQVALTLLSFGIRKTSLLVVGVRLDSHWLQCVRALAPVDIRVVEALLAQIIVRAGVAMIALAAKNFAATRNTLLYKLGSITVV